MKNKFCGIAKANYLFEVLKIRAEQVKKEGNDIEFCIDNNVVSDGDKKNMCNKLEKCTAELLILSEILDDLLKYQKEKGGILDGKKGETKII